METTQGTRGVVSGGDDAKSRKGVTVSLDDLYEHEADIAKAEIKRGAYGPYWSACQETGIADLAKQLAQEACSRSVHLANEWDVFVATMAALRTAGAPKDLVMKMERSALAIVGHSIDIAATVGAATAERDEMEVLYQRAIAGTEYMGDVRSPRWGKKHK